MHRNTIFPVFLYGCGTLTLTFNEERGLRVVENRVLRKIFGPKRDDVRGEWSILHNGILIVCIPHPILFG
jgi:hypothetical protein